CANGGNWGPGFDYW
nr:immunoglobulin heavy chain junction region [Macaca mulatta]MOV38598.1 immunoglobulin heavy chain junction region [Macaca mulatta]MOV41639.1 immunoglobulin heavy chain junction region [Macaca mulatta]MOV42998.1 immunoglobulin heavy chain junction region [Macaca mulatta]MOV44017.1 immunoglobulin heavy chain junction region [Macaca mulatta]